MGRWKDRPKFLPQDFQDSQGFDFYGPRQEGGKEEK